MQINKNPNNAASIAVKKLAVSMGIHRDLGLDSIITKPWNETEIAKVEAFGEEIANEKIVGQLYTLGVPYEKTRIESSVYAMSTDPIAYGMLRLDKQRGKAKADIDKKKTLFTSQYINLYVLALLHVETMMRMIILFQQPRLLKAITQER